MFGKKKDKTIFDYLTHHEPYHDIEVIEVPNYLEGVATGEHLELEGLMKEYWDLLHPAVADFINSYSILVSSMNKELSESRENVENARRQLTFEQQNVQDLTDSIREIKGELQSVLVVKRDLESRLDDERKMLETQFATEKRALEMIAESKVEGGNLDAILKSIKSGVGDTEEIKRLKEKIDSLEAKIKQEREENETIQGELSMSFMEKITKYDSMIKNLKARLNE